MKKTLLMLMLAIMVPFAVFAQSSGKIAGIVTDKSSGEPLPGVNVVIDGTSYGAATDEDGYFVILNVPVGVYNLTASFIGYASTTIEGLKVSAGITTEANFALGQTALEMEAIVIVAEKPLVEKNVTQSISLVTSQEIETIPVRGVQGIAATQNSVVVQDGQVHIRGGRSDEVGYYLDGASTNSITSRGQSMHIIQEAVEEFQVLTGGYSAEFGSANSGIIRTELKTGTEDYHVSMDFQTDKLASAGEKFLGTYSYRQHTFVTTFSGPVVSKKIKLFLAYENQDIGDTAQRFSEGWEFTNLTDQNPNNPVVANGNPETIDKIAYPDGYTPDQRFKRHTLNGTLLFDYNPIRFRLGMVWQNSRSQIDNGNPASGVLNTRDFWDTYNGLLLTAKLTHVLSPKTLYEARFNFFKRSQETEDDYFGTDWWKYYDSAAVYEKTNGSVVYRDAWHDQYQYLFNGFYFDRNGDPFNLYRKYDEQYIGTGIDFTSQIGRYHEVKAGFDYKYYTVKRYSIAPSVMSLTDTYGSLEDIPLNLISQYIGNTYGYDFLGSEISDGKTYGDSLTMQGFRHPVIGALYINDKIEFNDLIINAGVRLDYFDSDDRYLKNPENPEVDLRTNTIKESEWLDKDAEVVISPRFGFSFPVSEKTVFYMQYGKYSQLPSLDNVYYGTYSYQSQIVQGGLYFLTPVGFGLDPVKTTSYEIGFRQQLSNVAALDITGFYKNIQGQITVERVKAASNSLVESYDRMVNGDFATTKGMELKLRMKRTNRIMAQLNYTLTNAEGTGSSETSHHSAAYRGTVKPTLVNPLDYNRTHKGSVLLDYRFKKNDGGPVLENMGANLLFTFSSGHPYTLAYFAPGGQVSAWDAGVDYMNDTRSRQALEGINSSTTPWNYNLDLRVDKSFRLMDKLDATLYIRITNLLNTKNVINVYEGTGSADDDGIISRPAYSQSFIDQFGQTYVDMYRAINLKNGNAYYSVLGRELWSNPRQIMLGIKFSY